MLPSSYPLLFLLLCGASSSSPPPDFASLCEVHCLTPNECVKTKTKDGDDYTLGCRDGGPMRVDSDFYAKGTSWKCNGRKSGHFWTSQKFARPIKTIACIKRIPCQLANPLISSCRRSGLCTEVQLHVSSMPPLYEQSEPSKFLRCPPDAKMHVGEPGNTTALGQQHKVPLITCDWDSGQWTSTSSDKKPIVIPARSNVRCIKDKVQIDVINENDKYDDDDLVKKDPLEITSEKNGDTWKIYHLSATLLSLISGVACALYTLFVYSRWKRRTWDYVKQERLHRSPPLYNVHNIEKRKMRRRRKVAPKREHPRPSPPAPPPPQELKQDIVDGELRTAASHTSLLSDSSLDLHCSYDSDFSLMEYFLESNNNFEPPNKKPTADKKKKKATETGAKRPYKLRLEMYSDDEWEVVNPAPSEPGAETHNLVPPPPLDPLEQLALELGLETDDEPTSDSDSDESSESDDDEDSKRATTDTEMSSSSGSYYESFDPKAPKAPVPPGLRALEARIEEAIYKPGTKPDVKTLLTKEDVDELAKYMDEAIKAKPTAEQLEKRKADRDGSRRKVKAKAPKHEFGSLRRRMKISLRSVKDLKEDDPKEQEKEGIEELEKRKADRDGSRRKVKSRGRIKTEMELKMSKAVFEMDDSHKSLREKEAEKGDPTDIGLCLAELEKLTPAERTEFVNNIPDSEIVAVPLDSDSSSDASDYDADSSIASDEDTSVTGEKDAKAKTEDSDKTPSDSDSDSPVEEVDAFPDTVAFRNRKMMRLKQRRKKAALDDEQYETSYALDKLFTHIDRQNTQQEDFSGDDMDESWRERKNRKPEDEKKEGAAADAAPAAGAAAAGDKKPDAAAAPAKLPKRQSSAKPSAKSRAASRFGYKKPAGGLGVVSRADRASKLSKTMGKAVSVCEETGPSPH